MSGAAPGARNPRWRALGAAGALLVGLGLPLAAAPAASAQTAPPPAGGAVLAPGQTANSTNVRHIANLPKTGAFASEAAFNSDLAFQGNHVFAGNYNGFTVYDIRNPREPKQVVQLVCPGAQNDISVSGNLLFLSVDSRRTDDSCNSAAATAQQSATGQYWEGIRIFDISDPAKPEYVAAVETDCGSHTHTLVPSNSGRDIFVYVSSYGPAANIARCQPPHDKISIVRVPVQRPERAAVVATPVLFPNGGNPGKVAPPAETPATPTVGIVTPPTAYSATAGCHDITAYPAKGIAAGACMGEGVIMDISNPRRPRVVETVLDTENFAFWHSATFSDAADKVIFTDELGGGGAATCNPTIGPKKGANAIYTLDANRDLSLKSYYKIPRTQADTENCVAHNGSLIPVNGRDIMVQAWYQGGISVFDFTDPANPRELGWFDRGPISTERLVLGGSWSAYYYNGYVYSNDIQKGLDVLEVRGLRDRPRQLPLTYNPQTQPKLGR
jgi:hypothetical protein